MAKRLNEPYRAGRGDWLKLRHSETVDLTVVGVTGGPERPRGLVLGSYDGSKWRAAAVSKPVPRGIADELGQLVRPLTQQAVPLAFGLPGQAPLLHHPVEPKVIVEVQTDGTTDRGRWRHGVRVRRIRHDLL